MLIPLLSSFKLLYFIRIFVLYLILLYLEKFKSISSKHSWAFSGFNYLISVLSACSLYCTTQDFSYGVGLSLLEWILSFAAAIVDISLGDEMSIFHLFSICSCLVAGGGPLSQVRICLTFPVALQ